MVTLIQAIREKCANEAAELESSGWSVTFESRDGEVVICVDHPGSGRLDFAISPTHPIDVARAFLAYVLTSREFEIVAQGRSLVDSDRRQERFLGELRSWLKILLDRKQMYAVLGTLVKYDKITESQFEWLADSPRPWDEPSFVTEDAS